MATSGSVQDRVALRALFAQARGDGRLDEIKALRKNDHASFAKLILEFRTQCLDVAVLLFANSTQQLLIVGVPRCGSGGRGKARPRFDFTAFFTEREKGKMKSTGHWQAVVLDVCSAEQAFTCMQPWGSGVQMFLRIH